MPAEGCRLCGGREVQRFTNAGWSYGRCRRCGGITKQLTAREHETLGVEYDPEPALASLSEDELRAVLDVERRKTFLRPFVERLAFPVRFLDVGCGMGANLLAARELGCDVVGVEPSRRHSAIAVERFGLRVIGATFDPNTWGDRRFDLVLLSHVIEHVIDPAHLLHQVLEVVRPGGLVVVVTPNAASTVARWTGTSWCMLKPVDHVSLLTEKALRALELPEVDRLRVTQSQYVWEPLVGLLQAARDRMRGLETSNRVPRPGAVAQRLVRRRWLLATLSALSLPLHWWSVAWHRQACLVAELRKGGKVVSNGEER